MSGAYLHASNRAQGSLLGTFTRLSDMLFRMVGINFYLMRTGLKLVAPPTFYEQLFSDPAGPTVMAQYKLTYLNYRGRAELIRFILSQAGIDFEDCRIAPEEWQEYRKCI